MSRQLHGKAIVITGASSGIGWATAVACAAAGMTVTASGRRNDKLAELQQQIGRAGGTCHVVHCNVDREEDVARLFEESWAKWGRLDAVYANAGYGLVKPVLDTTDEETRAIFETNFHGTLRTLKAACPLLKQTPDGLRHMLVCSSSASEFAPPFYGVYAATKAAQDMVCGAMRAELRGEGIHVTSVHPVGTRTAFFEVAKREEDPSNDPLLNTPRMLMQTPETVARGIMKALRRPKPEVWPQPAARFALAATTAFPRLAAMVARRMMTLR